MNAADEPLPDGVWRRDRLPDGWRYWVTQSRRYSEPDQFRPGLITAIEQMRWYPPVGVALPLWSGLGMADLTQQIRFRGVGGIGISATPLEYPEDSYLQAHLDGEMVPLWSTYGLLGVKEYLPHGWRWNYFLDRGLEIGGLVFDEVTEQHPTDISSRCLLNRHPECAGVFEPPRSWLRTGTVVCRCSCGCRERSQRRGPDEPRDGLDHERQDLQPDRKGSTVTHDEPPKQE